MSEKPRDAATVVLVREDGSVYWVERTRRQALLGGFRVFPGGSVDREDASVEAAAIRETFEEVGVLLVPGAERVAAADLARARADLLAGKLAFPDVLREHGLELDPRVLHEAGRFVTPPFSPHRHDCRYFLARAPRGCQPSVLVGPELSSGEWILPGEAVARWRRDDAPLAAPTRLALEALSRAEGEPASDEWLARAAALVARGCPGPGDWHRRLEIRPGVFLYPVRTPTLPPATHTNVTLVGAGRKLVAIDPASPYPEERAGLDALVDSLAAEGKTLEKILLTHRHPDHVSGAEHLAARTGARIHAHREVRDALRGQVEVTDTLEDGDVLDLSSETVSRRLRAVLTPGHAVGHLAFHEEVSGTVAAGDLVAGFGFIVVDPPEGDMALYLRSLERLKSLGARLCFPAHGPPIGDTAAKVDEYVGHRLAREAKVRAAVQGGATSLEAVVKAAYEDTPVALHRLASRSALAHLIKLEAEGGVPAAGWGK